MTAPKVNWSERDEKYWVSNGDEVLWFKNSLDAKDAARKIEIDNAVKAEREAIVEWLRSDADAVVNGDPIYAADLIAEAIVECAQAIAAGEHMK